ncbi:MAG: SRPBCC family protein [Solirubrobacterales bacterium]|nr:SRPBCC family protein [Solirubrobacterales bacterium]
MRVEETFSIARPPEVVFDYVTNPANVSSWQTGNHVVEQLTDERPRVGSRFRERVNDHLSARALSR